MAVRSLDFFRTSVLGLLLISGGAGFSQAAENSPLPDASVAEATYQNYRTRAPWSIHVVRVPRGKSPFEFHSVHATKRAVGLGSLTRQIRSLDGAFGTPVAAINGDF